MIYLAGPINGCTDSESAAWRELVKVKLGEENCIDPFRRDYRGREDQSVSEIVELDKDDIYNCSIVLANCWQVSWGTAMEIHFAWSIAKQVIAVVPQDSRVSPWLRYHATVLTSLDTALQMIGENE